MTLLRLVLAELVGMFVDDEFLAIAVLGVVVVAAAASYLSQPLVAGLVLLVGCVGVLVTSAFRARR